MWTTGRPPILGSIIIILGVLQGSAAVDLACRFLSGSVRSPLLSLTLFLDSTGSLPHCSAWLAASCHPHQFFYQSTYRSLEVFKRSYRGRIPHMEPPLIGLTGSPWISCHHPLQCLYTVYSWQCCLYISLFYHKKTKIMPGIIAISQEIYLAQYIIIWIYYFVGCM